MPAAEESEACLDSRDVGLRAATPSAGRAGEGENEVSEAYCKHGIRYSDDDEKLCPTCSAYIPLAPPAPAPAEVLTCDRCKKPGAQSTIVGYWFCQSCLSEINTPAPAPDRAACPESDDGAHVWMPSNKFHNRSVCRYCMAYRSSETGGTGPLDVERAVKDIVAAHRETFELLSDGNSSDLPPAAETGRLEPRTDSNENYLADRLRQTVADLEAARNECRAIMESRMLWVRNYDALEETLATERAALEATRAALDESRKALWDAQTVAPPHDCEFTSNPEKGACDWCEAYADWFEESGADDHLQSALTASAGEGKVK